MFILHGLTWWQATFFVIGIFALVTAFVSLFFAFGEQTEYVWATKLPQVDSEDFLEAVSQTVNAPIQQGGSVKILNNGSEFMKAMLRAFEQAEASINFTAYIWEPGRMSDAIFKTLIEKVKEGVEVRILLDHLGALKLSSSKLEALKKRGAKIARFRTPKFGKLLRFHRRTHRRAIIVDGKIAFTGGMAVGDKWYGGEYGQPEWRDMMYQVRGAMARALQGVFAELWAGTYGEILVGRKFYPRSDTEDADAVSEFVSVASSPAPDTQPLPKFFWLSISSAQERLYVNSPYVVPDRHIRKAFIDRARAGVDVRFLVPSGWTDAKPIRQAMHYFYSDYLKAGIRIFEYQPSMIHSKYLVADSLWSVVGSANMDNRSKRLNEENVLGVLDPAFGTELESEFLEDIKKSREITLATWGKRPWHKRLLEFFCVFFVEQF